VVVAFRRSAAPGNRRVFSGESKENPSLWNGRLLSLRDVQFAEQTLSGTFFETDYASLLAALAWEAMGPAVKACFPR
jgi:hypothetical protein